MSRHIKSELVYAFILLSGERYHHQPTVTVRTTAPSNIEILRGDWFVIARNLDDLIKNQFDLNYISGEFVERMFHLI